MQEFVSSCAFVPALHGAEGAPMLDNCAKLNSIECENEQTVGAEDCADCGCRGLFVLKTQRKRKHLCIIWKNQSIITNTFQNMSISAQPLV